MRESKYSVGRYDTFAVDKKLILVFTVGGVYFGLSAVFLAEIIQAGSISYDSKDNKILGTINIRGEKVPLFDIVGYFGLGDGTGDSKAVGKRTGADKKRSADEVEGAAVESMIILKRGLGDSSELQRMGIIVDHIEGVMDEGEFKRFPFPNIALNESTKIYKELMISSGNLVLLLNIPWLMEMIL